MYKIRAQDDKEHGPYMATVVEQWIKAKRADAQTPGLRVGDTEWKPLSEFPEFQAALGVTPPASAATAAGSPASPAVAYPAETCRLAVSSVVLGALGFLGITGVAGLITGLLSLKRISRSGGRLRGMPWAVTGSVLSGCMVLLALPAWTGLLLVPYMKAKQQKDEIRCLENMQILNDALQSYAEAHEGRLPNARTWSDQLVQAQLISSSNPAFRCPSQSGGLCSYAFNRNLSDLVLEDLPDGTVILFESDLGWNGQGDVAIMATSRHGLYQIIGFVNGTVQKVPAWQVPQLRWLP